MKSLIHFALRRRGLVVGFTLALMAAGLYALQHIPFDAFPDLTGTRVEVITVAPGMAPEEVERLVTYPIESGLMGVPGAEGVRSVSKFGLSLVTVPFPDNVDVYFARQLVQQRLSDAKSALPAGVEPALGPVSTPMGELYQYVLTSDSLSLTQLKTLHDYVIRPRLRTVPGVSEVNSWGGLTERVEVIVDPVRLAGFQHTVVDVHNALVGARGNGRGSGAGCGGLAPRRAGTRGRRRNGSSGCAPAQRRGHQRRRDRSGERHGAQAQGRRFTEGD
jgi:heavy metal efflux system protein